MTYFETVTSKNALPRAATLRQRLVRLPAASAWGADELSAFRVVVVAPNARARVLRHFADQSRFTLDEIRKDPDLAGLAGLVRRAPPDLPLCVETDLAARFGPTLGQFWSALADVMVHGQEEQGALVQNGNDATAEGRAETDDESVSLPSSPEPPPPKRIRRRAEYDGMIDPTQERFASSSPHQTNSQVCTDDDAFVPTDDGAETARELMTERLLTCFVRHVLCSTPHARLFLQNRLECRARLPVAVSTEGGRSIRAEDDGGLRLRALWPDKGEHAYHRSRRSDCYHLLFEAKRRFLHIHDGRPTISDAWLGQMTAEALAARLIRREHYRDPDVFVVAAARQHVCFLQFHITDEYLTDVEAEKPHLTLPVTSTQWLDLSEPQDRGYAMLNMLGLIQLSG
ncbi:hypothetical protein GGR56DRAFT_154996 [Xylariaceae sp. FL0804]|nr:hypothetical protein GGR56DRAFT_154996 [Xylariaceae sp. FL0804]